MKEQTTVQSDKVERLLEIQERLDLLEEQDILVLQALKKENENVPVDFCFIASEIFVLPRLVEESLEKLMELGFVSQGEEKPTFLKINQNGIDAKKLLNIFR